MYFDKILNTFENLNLENKKLLSIGCGMGNLENFLAKKLNLEVNGINELSYSKKFPKFKFDKKNKNINYWDADFIAYNFKKKKYDIIFLQNSLFFLIKYNYDPHFIEYILRKIDSLLNSDGFIIVINMNTKKAKEIFKNELMIKSVKFNFKYVKQLKKNNNYKLIKNGKFTNDNNILILQKK